MLTSPRPPAHLSCPSSRSTRPTLSGSLLPMPVTLATVSPKHYLPSTHLLILPHSYTLFLSPRSHSSSSLTSTSLLIHSHSPHHASLFLTYFDHFHHTYLIHSNSIPLTLPSILLTYSNFPPPTLTLLNYFAQLINVGISLFFCHAIKQQSFFLTY